MDKDLLKKLKALAEQGVGGEKDNAREMLDRLMEKYGVSEADISSNKLEMHDFHYHNNWDKQLLQRIIEKIAADRDIYLYRGGQGSRTTFVCCCTKAEALQIQIEYEFHSALWQEELRTFFCAYIAKHRLFDPTPHNSDNEPDSELIKRMQILMAGMQDKEPVSLIEEC